MCLVKFKKHNPHSPPPKKNHHEIFSLHHKKIRNSKIFTTNKMETSAYSKYYLK